MFGLFSTPEEKLRKSVDKAIDKEISIMLEDPSSKFIAEMNVQFAIMNVYKSHNTASSLLAQGHNIPQKRVLEIIKECCNKALMKNFSNAKDLLIP